MLRLPGPDDRLLSWFLGCREDEAGAVMYMSSFGSGAGFSLKMLPDFSLGYSFYTLHKKVWGHIAGRRGNGVLGRSRAFGVQC